ncbi:MAG: DUF1016 domain-containing protein [Candidatus Margulisbacteria bacterium]|nr:DUF1016 domain-containing protein [Candidatus Margulisiibacteriota bacterium]
MSGNILDKSYTQTLLEIKRMIDVSRRKAAFSINREMLILYWKIGHIILVRKEKEGWGTKIVKQLSCDLKKEMTDIRGFSPRNMVYMQQFASAYPKLLIDEDSSEEDSITQQVVAQIKKGDKTGIPKAAFLNIPWGHNVAILDKKLSKEKQLWYAQQTIAEGWSRNVLVHQIESEAFERQAIKGKKSHNFHFTLPEKDSDLAEQILKDDYNLNFLDIEGKLSERKLEKALVDDIKNFIIELGTGFAFVSQQHRLEVDGEEFFCDLLFYHLRLHCYIVIELKTGKFKPEYTGKMGFYLGAVDKYLKTDQDNYSIGIILCQKHSKTIRDLSLQCMTKPIGVSGYTLTKKIPEEIKQIQGVEKLLEGSSFGEPR